jgi:hypothetical protein
MAALSHTTSALVREIDANATLVVFPSRRGRPLRRFDPGEWSIGIEAAAGITKDRRSTAVQSPARSDTIANKRRGFYC